MITEFTEVKLGKLTIALEQTGETFTETSRKFIRYTVASVGLVLTLVHESMLYPHNKDLAEILVPLTVTGLAVSSLGTVGSLMSLRRVDRMMNYLASEIYRFQEFVARGRQRFVA